MEIRFDYYIKQDGYNRIMHHTVTEDEIVADLEKRFREGDLPCPIHFDIKKCQVEFIIDKVIV